MVLMSEGAVAPLKKRSSSTSRSSATARPTPREASLPRELREGRLSARVSALQALPPARGAPGGHGTASRVRRGSWARENRETHPRLTQGRQRRRPNSAAAVAAATGSNGTSGRGEAAGGGAAATLSCATTCGAAAARGGGGGGGIAAAPQTTREAPRGARATSRPRVDRAALRVRDRRALAHGAAAGGDRHGDSMLAQQCASSQRALHARCNARCGASAPRRLRERRWERRELWLLCRYAQKARHVASLGLLMSSALPFAARAAVARLLRPPLASPRAPSRPLSPSQHHLARRAMAAPAYDGKPTPAPEGMSRVLFVQVGMGIDQHGQDATKAAVRAVKHAIETNSIPCAKDVCGSYDAVKIHVKLGVPFPDQRIDAAAIEKARKKQARPPPWLTLSIAPPGVPVRTHAAAAGGARRPGGVQRHHGAADGRRRRRHVHHRRRSHCRPLGRALRGRGGQDPARKRRDDRTQEDSGDELKAPGHSVTRPMPPAWAAPRHRPTRAAPTAR